MDPGGGVLLIIATGADTIPTPADTLLVLSTPGSEESCYVPTCALGSRLEELHQDLPVCRGSQKPGTILAIWYQGPEKRRAASSTGAEGGREEDHRGKSRLEVQRMRMGDR